MTLFGCSGAPDDGSDPATSSQASTDAVNTVETVTPRVGFGQFAPKSTAATVALAARPLVEQEPAVGKEEVVTLRSVFSPTSLKRTEPFRVRVGVPQ